MEEEAATVSVTPLTHPPPPPPREQTAKALHRLSIVTGSLNNAQDGAAASDALNEKAERPLSLGFLRCCGPKHAEMGVLWALIEGWLGKSGRSALLVPLNW